MATQSCPRCKSDRIRSGYRPTSFFQKLMFRYNLLCDNCNWEFIGFAIPGTVSSKSKRRKKISEGHHGTPLKSETDSNGASENIVNGSLLNASELEASGEPDKESVDLDIQSKENDFIAAQNNKKRGNKIKKRARVKLS